MVAQTELLVRPAVHEDRHQLTNLLHFEPHVHRHLDWRPPLDWLGHPPFVVSEKENSVVAAMACPPDPPGVAWIRMFACTSVTPVNQAWDILWPSIQNYLSEVPDIDVAAIPLQPWFRELLEKNKFSNTHNVLMLTWDNDMKKIPKPNTSATMRMMTQEDLEAVTDIDSGAFGRLWKNSFDSLKMAFKQAVIATVAEKDGQIVAYQISTPNPIGAHLARLAVHQDCQGQGIGYAVVHHLLDHFKSQSKQRISVNTQHDNQASLSLYKKAGFVLTGEGYPVFQYSIS